MFLVHSQNINERPVKMLTCGMISFAKLIELNGGGIIAQSDLWWWWFNCHGIA